MKKIIFAFSVFMLAFNFLNAQTYNIIYNFDSTNSGGAYPYGSLIVSGSKFYGTTFRGGTFGNGSIYSINPDGSGYKTLYSFRGDKSDGLHPYGSLIESDSYLYGITKGGTLDSGTVYKINKDGNGFSLLHSFYGGKNDGKFPIASLVYTDSFLYGITLMGGETDSGTVFKIKTDGSGFSLLHSFDYKQGEGYYPFSSLLLIGSVLFGVTPYGGDNYMSDGTVYKLNIDGSGFKILNNFYFFNMNTSSFSTMTNIGKILYGMTCCGRNTGSIFKLNTDSTGYTTLHTFIDRDTSNGAFPYGPLISSDNMLFGMTRGGGKFDNGTVFKFNLVDSTFKLLHSFGEIPLDGSGPWNDGLLIYNNSIYGLTTQGGSNGLGLIFTLSDSTKNDTSCLESINKLHFDNSTDISYNSSSKLQSDFIRLVSSSPNLAGSIFYKQPITVSNGFNTEFSFRFTNGYNDVPDGSPSGADGIAFVIQATNPGYYGKTGGGLGYSGISNSLAVEFDDYKDDNDLEDPDGSHIAVFSNGKEANSSDHHSSALLACTSKIPLLKADSTLYFGKIEYLLKEKKLNIYLDTTGDYKIPVLVVDSINLTKLLNLFDGTNAYPGFTSATGASYQNTDIISWSFCSKKGNGIQSDVEQTPPSVPNVLNIYPNPVSDFISIKTDSKTGKLEIYSVLGECVMIEQTSQFVPNNIQKIDVSTLSTGIYFVKIGEKVLKFVKI